MGITQPAATNTGRGRGNEKKLISAATRELRSSSIGIVKKDMSKQKSLSRERVSFSNIKRSVSTGDKGKRKAEAMEEEEGQHEQEQQVVEGEEETEMEVEEEGRERPRGQDIREEVAGEYNVEGKAENGGTTARKGQQNVKRKPRYNGEIEVPKGMESATFAEAIEEECYRFNSFLGVRVARERGKEKKIIATFGNTIDMHDACNINFGSEQERKFLIPTEQVLQQQDLGRQVIVRDIPLAVSEGAIKTLLRKFGEIEKILFRTVEMWQTAIVTFQDEEVAKILAEHWSIPFGKEHLRILPGVGEKEELKRRSEFVLKIAGLPAGTTAYDLEEINKEIKGKTMYIPRTINYFRERYAYVAFETEEHMQQALGKDFQMDNTNLKMVHQYEKLCYKCGNKGHFAYQCGEVRIQRDREMAQARFIAIQSRFRKGPEGSAPITYAEALRKRSRSRSNVRGAETDSSKNWGRRLEKLEARMEKIEKSLQKLCETLMPREEGRERNEEEDSTMDRDEPQQYEDAEEEWNIEREEVERQYGEKNREIENRQARIESQMDSLNQRIGELLEKGNLAVKEGQHSHQ
jgi:hypothetical protein